MRVRIISGELLVILKSAWIQSYFCSFSPFISTKPTEVEEKAIKKVDELLETYMGIRDIELGEFLTDTLLQD